MTPKDRAQVCWIFASEDASIARELIGRAGVLEAQGLLQNWEFSGAQLGLATLSGATSQGATLRRADVAIFLCSQALLDGFAWQKALDVVAENPRTRVVPVVVNATTLPLELAAFQVLPRDGKPLMGRPDRDEALLEVIQGLLATIKYRQEPRGHKGLPQPFPLPLGGRPPSSINDIFRLDGPPTVTFIEPAEFPKLKLELRTMGTGLIVAGPSKVGKSTAIRKALEALEISATDQIRSSSFICGRSTGRSLPPRAGTARFAFTPRMARCGRSLAT